MARARTARSGRGWEALGVVVLLTLHASLALTSLRVKSLTFDEIAYLVGGSSYWAYGDYRLNPEAGPLPQRLAALPLALAGIEPPDREDPAWSAADPWRLGNRWLYHSSLEPDAVVLAARSAMVGASVAFGLLVFLWSRSLWGVAGGFVSLLAYATSPSVLAHARLATSDLAAAGFLLAAVGSLWRLANRVTLARALVAALASAALLLSKYSGLIILPLAALLVAVVVRARRVTPWRLGPWLGGRARGAARCVPLAAGGLAVGLAVFALLWGAYGLRFEISPEAVAAGSDPVFRPWQQVLSSGGVQATAIDWTRTRRLLPEGFLYGWAHTVYAGQQRRAFLLGEHSLTGFPSFFPVLFAAKTSPALLGLLGIALGVVGAAARWRRRGFVVRSAPLWLLALLYAGVALSSSLNIGHRHLLPFELALIVLAGAAGHRLARGRWWRRSLVIGALGFMAFESLRIWPDYLAYWSPLVGGPSQGYRIAVDSSLDWGQDLTRLAEELAKRRARGDEAPSYLAYFGSASPAHHGIEARRLTSYLNPDWSQLDLRPLDGGSYWISATQLQNLYTRAPGHWTRDYEWRYQLLRGLAQAVVAAGGDETRKALARSVGGEAELERNLALYADLRFARLAAFLRQREPDQRIGYSIHEYRLSDAEVWGWLDGPPPPQRSASGYESDPEVAGSL